CEMCIRDSIYVCLGTTIKKAGSRANFRRVDFEYVHIAAQLARAQRAASFVWISSVGANAKSRNFYLRVKGELENAIMKMTGLEHASGVRPSLLLGEREEKRFGEWLGARLAKIMAPLFKGKLAKYRPVSAHEVAAQMIRLQRF
ncbi:MAG: epimerase, partial [Paraglaciecola sp.]|nr:epimerase [Paraglaciecola sp.]